MLFVSYIVFLNYLSILVFFWGAKFDYFVQVGVGGVPMRLEPVILSTSELKSESEMIFANYFLSYSYLAESVSSYFCFWKLYCLFYLYWK